MTWTDLLNRPDGGMLAVDAPTLRNLLMDLIGHPGVNQLVRVTLTLRDGRRLALSLGDRPALQAGASGPMFVGAAELTREVAPLVYEAPERVQPPPGEWRPELAEVSAWSETLRATAGELRAAVDDAINGRVQPEKGKVIIP